MVDGIQKSYYLNEGKQHVIAFTYPPSFSEIPDSFLNQQPSNYFLETLTDNRFLRLSYEQHKELMAEYPPIETMFRKATEHILNGVAIFILCYRVIRKSITSDHYTQR